MSVGRGRPEILSSGLYLVARVLQARGPNCRLRLRTFQSPQEATTAWRGKHGSHFKLVHCSQHAITGWLVHSSQPRITGCRATLAFTHTHRPWHFIL